jgi:hypothetical protein
VAGLNALEGGKSSKVAKRYFSKEYKVL